MKKITLLFSVCLFTLVAATTANAGSMLSGLFNSKKVEAPSFAESSSCDASADHIGRDVFIGIHLGDNESDVWCALHGAVLAADSSVRVSWGSNPLIEYQMHHFPTTIRATDGMSGATFNTLSTFSDVVPKLNMFNGDGNVPSLYPMLDQSSAKQAPLERSLVRLPTIRPDLPDVYYIRDFCPSFDVAHVMIGSTSYSLEISFDSGANNQFNYAPLVKRLIKGIKPSNLGLYNGAPVYPSCEIKGIVATLDRGKDNEIRASIDAEAILDQVVQKFAQPKVALGTVGSYYQFMDASDEAHLLVRLNVQRTTSGLAISKIIFDRKESRNYAAIVQESEAYKASLSKSPGAAVRF